MPPSPHAISKQPNKQNGAARWTRPGSDTNDGLLRKARPSGERTSRLRALVRSERSCTVSSYSIDHDLLASKTAGSKWRPYDPKYPGCDVTNCSCPVCGPNQLTTAKQLKKTLGVIRDVAKPGFFGFSCNRCHINGGVGDRSRKYSPIDHAKLAQIRAIASEQARINAAEKLRIVRWIWSRRRALLGTVAHNYLLNRLAGRIELKSIPGTLGYLPPSWKYPDPALIAAYGFPREIEPGVLSIADDAVMGIHIIKLKPDGSWHIGGEDAKITVGWCMGVPIVLAPFNDQLTLYLAEGPEKAFIAHLLTGAAAWAAGGCTRMAALAASVPKWVCRIVTMEDDDDGGRKGTQATVDALFARGFTNGGQSRVSR
jgi:hypothetical protein